MNASYSTKSDVFAFAIVCWGLMHWQLRKRMALILAFSSYDRESIKDMVWKERFRLPVDSRIPIGLSSMVTSIIYIRLNYAGSRITHIDQ